MKFKRTIAALMVAVTLFLAVPFTAMGSIFAADTAFCSVEKSYIKDTSESEKGDCFSCFDVKFISNIVNYFVQVIKRTVIVLENEKNDIKEFAGALKSNFNPINPGHILYYLTDEMIQRILEKGLSLSDVFKFIIVG